MESRSAWIQQQRSGISFDELSSMVSELVARFESEPASQKVDAALDWISPSGRTRVVRHGSSASLHNVLNQVPDAVAAEYDVLYLGAQVFSWRDFLWPHLNTREQKVFPDDMVYMPEACLNELMDFHIRYDTAWLRRFRLQPRLHPSTPANDHICTRTRLGKTGDVQIDKIRVVAQTNRIELQ